LSPHSSSTHSQSTHPGSSSTHHSGSSSTHHSGSGSKHSESSSTHHSGSSSTHSGSSSTHSSSGSKKLVCPDVQTIADTPCKVSGGVCQEMGCTCPGGYVIGKCGGAATRKCCLSPHSSSTHSQSTHSGSSSKHSESGSKHSESGSKHSESASRSHSSMASEHSSLAGSLSNSTGLVCPDVQVAQDVKCTSGGGACQNTSCPCPGGYVTGKCSGPVNRKCCLGAGGKNAVKCPDPVKMAGDEKCFTAFGGQCQNDACPCTKGYATGYCGGPTHRRCCKGAAHE